MTRVHKIGAKGGLVLLVAATVTFSAAPAQAYSCRIEVVRAAPENAPWDMGCGGHSLAPPPRYSVNQLGTIPVCGASPTCASCPPPPPLAPTSVPPRLVTLPEPPTGLPPCVRSPTDEWVEWGFVNLHRSCFRTLSSRDRVDLTGFAAHLSSTNPAGTSCALRRFEGAATAVVPDQQTWADEFKQDYPDRTNPVPNPGASVYRAFRTARDANEHCLDRFNPRLARRVRQAMGIEARSSSTRVVRPRVSCSEHEVYECQVQDKLACARLQDELGRSYGEDGSIANHPGIRRYECDPVSLGSSLLGLTEGPVIPGRVVANPRIHLFDTTGRYHTQAESAATVLHEFLHAAGGLTAPNHNHGPLAGGAPPPGDQVYACEALAFARAYPSLSGTALEQVCRDCADSAHDHLCRGGVPVLSAMGCRR